MKDGFLKVATATPVIRLADCAYNAGQILGCMGTACRAGAKLLVLPELCVTGYTCGDLFLQSALLEQAQAALETVRAGSQSSDLLIVAGAPLEHKHKLYNCAVFIQNGQYLAAVPKTHLPNYGEFYERRWFSPAPLENGSIPIDGVDVPFGSRLLLCCNELPTLCVSAEICEDLWAADPPSTRHAIAGATVIVNPSCSDEIIGKAQYRRSLGASQSARLCCAYLYAGAGDGESSTDMVFAGHNLIYENGALLDETPLFQNGMAISEIDLSRLVYERRRLTSFPAVQDDGYLRIPFSLCPVQTALTRLVSAHPFIPSSDADRAERCEEILSMQAAGLARRLDHAHAKTAVVGLSGGLDSTLALLVMVRAMKRLGRPASDILAVTMPCFGTTRRTKSNAQRLADAYGVTFREVDITAAVNQHFADIGQDPAVTDVTYENCQARERTQVLMDLANQQGGLVVGTGDLSELALGWATYNGDHMSMYGVNASVPKTLIRHIVAYEASIAPDETLRRTLEDILATPVSPELLPAKNGTISQKTEDLVGPYELHDFFLYYAVRWAFPPSKIYRLACYAFGGAYEPATIKKWLVSFYRRFFSQQFKRSCLPDGPKVGSVTLSPRGDWRMPSDASAALWLEQAQAL
ncbi:MAG: NAD(+) synthase [Oscillospiraceae bacterium]|nr:NAD(+) synthase [Oscillospiraceae bacterium]